MVAVAAFFYMKGGVSLEYITKSNISVVSKKTNIASSILSKYEVMYKGKIPCRIIEHDGTFLFVAGTEFKNMAEQEGFRNDNGEMVADAAVQRLAGYRSFGCVNADGDNIYWCSRASSGEDEKMPGVLDYFRVSRAEFANKTLLKINADSSFIAQMPLTTARIGSLEAENIKNAVLDGREVRLAQNLPAIINRRQAADDDTDDGYDDYEEKKHLLPGLGFIDGITSRINRRMLIIVGIATGLLFGAMIAMMTVVSLYTPNSGMADLTAYYGIMPGDDLFVLYNGEPSDEQGIIIDDTAYVTYGFAHDVLNGRLYYDSGEDIMFLSTPEEIYELHNKDKKVVSGGGSETLKKPAYQITNDGTVWVQLQFLSEHSAFSYHEIKEPRIVSITCREQDGEIPVSKTAEDTPMRTDMDIKAGIVENIPAGMDVEVIKDCGEWLQVQSETGLRGYVNSESMGDIKNRQVKQGKEDGEYRHNLYDGKICMAWHQVTNKSANANIEAVLERTDGANIICPTWFYLNDIKGGIADLGDRDYVDSCHGKGILVWGLVSNLENPKVDAGTVLHATSTRKALEANIVAVAKKYGLDGINIDFESLRGESGEDFLQFIRELAIMLDDTGIVLSVDNYVPSDYTQFYGRTEQALYADYIVVMAYDEHTGGSAKAGSTASMPWVRQGIENTLEQVPKRQTVLGIPLYTRIWKTKDGIMSSEAVGIDAVAKILEENNADITWDEKLGQYHALYTDSDGNLCEVWVEDANSLNCRLSLMRNYNLAGAAFWKTGLESSETWNEIAKGYAGDSAGGTQKDAQAVQDSAEPELSDTGTNTPAIE